MLKDCHAPLPGDPTHPLHLLLPHEDLSYRFHISTPDGEAVKLTDRLNPTTVAPIDDDWSLLTAAFAHREWTLLNTSPATLTGTLQTLPAGRIRLLRQDRWLELGSGQARTLEFQLEPQWLEKWRQDSAAMSLYLQPTVGERKELLHITFRRQRLSSPAVRLLGPAPDSEALMVRQRDKVFGVELVLDNPGDREARVWLKVGYERSEEVTIPPSSQADTEQRAAYFFTLTETMLAAIEKEECYARLQGESSIAWHPDGLRFRPRLVLTGGNRMAGSELSYQGDLCWQAERKGRSWNLTLVLVHRGPDPAVIHISNILRNDRITSLETGLRVTPGVRKELFQETIRPRWFLRKVHNYKAEIVLRIGSEEKVRRASWVLDREENPRTTAD